MFVQKISQAAYQHHVAPKSKKNGIPLKIKIKYGPKSDQRSSDRAIIYEPWTKIGPVERLTSLII